MSVQLDATDLFRTVLTSKEALILLVTIVVIGLVVSLTNICWLSADIKQDVADLYVHQVEAYRTDIPIIAGIPEVPSALPFLGHLHQLGGRFGKNDSTIFSEWSQKVASPVYQCKLGNQRTVVVCDWATMHDLWVGQSHSLIDRPHQPGFLDKLGVDLTSSPMTPQIRKCRAAGMRALGKVCSWPHKLDLGII